MTRILAALALALMAAVASPAVAARHHRAVCAPVFLDGVGTVRICPVPLQRPSRPRGRHAV